MQNSLQASTYLYTRKKSKKRPCTLYIIVVVIIIYQVKPFSDALSGNYKNDRLIYRDRRRKRSNVRGALNCRAAILKTPWSPTATLSICKWASRARVRAIRSFRYYFFLSLLLLCIALRESFRALLYGLHFAYILRAR